MATRLEVTYGLIAGSETRPTSADTQGVSHPSTGSQTRSKGVLAIIVSSAGSGMTSRPATQLVSETIRNEYYYDESAGVPVCLEKAIRSADRRLRGSREGAGLSPGSLGIGVAVVRNNELYLATIGAVEAYLVRNARLLMPDRRIIPGLPGGVEESGVDVWRGELSVGDALLLVSRNITETVGTEELKSAILTLHPQAAVEHLHHLFVAAGGEGSDAMIAVEATERSTHIPSRPRPARGGAALGDLPRMPAPIGPGTGSAVAIGRNPIGQAIARSVDRAWELMPSRRPSIRRMSPRISQAETQRRAALGVLAFVGIVFVLGVIVMLLPRGVERSPEQVAGGDSALSVASDRAQRAANLAAAEPLEATALYREAFSEIARARATGVRATALDQLETQVRSGLDVLYGARAPEARVVAAFEPGAADPVGLTRGPGGDAAAYYIDRAGSSVHRVDLKSGDDVEIIVRGDKAVNGGHRIGEPLQIETGGLEVVIVDDDARAWRWRPSDETGRGTLARLNLGGDGWSADHGDIETYTDANGYRIYVVEPEQGQILRYQPTLDQSSFMAPTDYLITESDEVAGFRQLHIDFDLWALDDEGVQKYKNGRFEGGFMVEDPPDGADVRPGHDYQLVSGTGTDASGRLYLYDAVWERLVVFDKTNGQYIGQWTPGPDGPSMEDMRGFYIDPKARQKPEAVVWVTPEGVYEAKLTVPSTRDPSATEKPTRRDRRDRGKRDSG